MRAKLFTLSILTLLLATLAHAVFVTRDDVIPARVSGGNLVSDTVRDGVDTVPVSGTTGTPILLFSDLVSGPDVGLGDGLGSGVIVTVWGQNLGSSQGDSVIEYCDALAVCRAAAHVYYWKNANGVAPSGPANLYESHRMQEIAFSIPDSASGTGTIRVRVGADQTTLPFTVRAGNIYHVMPNGSNSNPGTFAQPWQTQARVGHTQSGGTTAPAGSTVYFHGVFSGGIGSGRGIYVNNTAATAPDAITNFFYVAYPGAHSTASGQEGFSNYQIAGTAISKFRVEASNCTETANGQRTGCSTSGTWGIRTDKWGRVVANYITDQPGRCASRYQAAISGSAENEDNVGNAKIFGNEIEEYGCYGSDALHHTTYLTIRSAPNDLTVEPWEFGWNYLHDNDAKSGIHNFDQDTGCGTASGPIIIRNNVVVNQAGPGIYFGGQCGWDMDAYIENNIVINAGLPADWLGTGDPDTSQTQTEPGGIIIRMSGEPPLAGYSGSIFVRNNIIYGWGWDGMDWYGQGCLSLTGSSSTVDLTFTDNVCVATHHDRIFGWNNNAGNQHQSVVGDGNSYYRVTGSIILPAFDANPITANPLLQVNGAQIGVEPGSPLIDISDTALIRDIYGRLRTKPNSNLGAVE